MNVSIRSIRFLWMKSITEVHALCIVGNGTWYEDVGCSALRGWVCPLANGACIRDDYQTSDAPGSQKTNVKVTLDKKIIREVDDRKHTIKVDFAVTFWWEDPRIMTDLLKVNKEEEGIEIMRSSTGILWQPMEHIHHLVDFSEYHNTKQITNFKVWSNDLSKPSATVVEKTHRATIRIYCDFDFSSYPMDHQHCSFKIGTPTKSNLIYWLYEPKPDRSVHKKTLTRTAGFYVTTTFIGAKRGDALGLHYVGFRMEMDRILQPYIFKY